MRRRAFARRRPARSPTAARVEPELHQADRRRPRRHAVDPATATRWSTASRRPTSPTRALRQRGACNLPKPITDSARPLLHDGRQPWSQRRQPLLGTRPPRLDHRQGLRHLLAPRPDRLPLSPRPGIGAPAPAGAHAAGCSPSTAACGSRFVAGADEAGRGCLAGPLVAAAVLIDYETLSHCRPPCPRRPARLQADAAEEREEMYPAVLRAAERVCVVVRCVARDRRPRPPRHQHRSARQRPGAAARRGRSAICLVDGFSLPRCAVPHRRRGRGRRHQRRDRRRLGGGQGDPRPLHARGGAATPAGASRSTSATRPPSTARRSTGSGSRRCTAAASRASPTPSSDSPDRPFLTGASRRLVRSAEHTALPASLICLVRKPGRGVSA